MGSRGGDMTTFANLSLCSQTESWTTSASYSSGVSGRNVGLSTAYSGSGDNASMLKAAHALTGASIMQLTARRTDRLSMVGLIEGAGHVLSKIPAAIRLTKDLGRAILLAEDAREHVEEAAKKVAGESTSAATGGPKGQLPDGEDPEKKESEEKHFEVPQSQQELNNFIERADRTGSGLKADPFHRASSYGTQGTANIDVQKILGGDGRPYVRLIKEAVVNDQPGFFEYLVDSTGKITHQLFKAL